MGVRGGGAQGRDPTPAPPACGHLPGAGSAEAGRQPTPRWGRRGRQPGRSAEAQRRDAGRAAARQPRAPRTRPWAWPGSPQQFRARGGAGNGPGGQQRPRRARPRAACHSPFEMLDDLLFPHILR